MTSLILASLASVVLAQQPGLSITAEVDRSAAALNEQIVLSVTVTGNRTDLPDPELPSMPNMTVYSSGRSQNISFVNGQVSSSIVYTYVLVPRFVGKSVIGPVGVTVGGQRYETRPIPLQVTRPNEQGEASPTTPPRQTSASGRLSRPAVAGAPDVFVTATVDKPKAYVNEQVTLTVRFHTAVTLLGNPSYNPPSVNGFLSEDLPPEHHAQTRVNGRDYQYSEIKTALFPAQSGKLTVGPALVQVQVQTAAAVDPFAPDFFQKFFSQGMLAGQTRQLKTDPVSVAAEPLPEAGKPSSFSGAVGQFKVTGVVDKRKLKVGDALTLTVTVEGAGNLKALGTIKIPDSPSFRAYDTVTSLNLNKSGDEVRGSKVFRTVLVPRVSGTLTLPSIPFSFFDPRKREYVHAGTVPIEVEVAPGAGSGPGTSYVSNTAPGGGEVTTFQDDIRYVKESASFPETGGLLATLAAHPAAHAIPLALFLASLALGGYRERLLLDPKGARSRRAAGRAQSLLDEAEGFAEGDAARSASKVAEALAGFIADKLGRSPSGLTLREAQEAIRARFSAVGPQELERLKELWEEVEELRFAGGGDGGTAHAVMLATGVSELVRELEKKMTASKPRNGARLAAAAALLLLGASAARAAEVSAETAEPRSAAVEAFKSANKSYRDGDYTKAAEGYAELLGREPRSAALHFDLANARFKEGAPHALGLAIAGYLRASELAPRDGDVRHNLEFALARAGEPLVPPGTPRALFLLYHVLSREELLGLQWIGYWACLLLGSCFVLAPSLRERVKSALVGALCFWALFGGWWALGGLGSSGPLGVVLEPNAEARSGPGRNFPVSFNAPEGRRVAILSDSGEWLEVGVLKEGVKGWMLAKSVERVFP